MNFKLPVKLISNIILSCNLQFVNIHKVMQNQFIMALGGKTNWLNEFYTMAYPVAIQKRFAGLESSVFGTGVVVAPKKKRGGGRGSSKYSSENG